MDRVDKPIETTLLPDTLFMGSIHLDILDRIKVTPSRENFVADAVTTLLAPDTPVPVWTKLVDWSTTHPNSLLRFQGRIYVPPSDALRCDVVHLYHNLPSAGHPSKWKTFQNVSRDFWWPGQYRFIQRYVEGCALCQQFKVNMHPTHPPLHPIATSTSAYPFSCTTMDFITGLPDSNGYNALLVLVDHDCSWGVILHPCTDKYDALDMVKAIHNTVYRWFGLPEKFISDRGPQFASKVFSELAKLLKIQTSLSMAYHPQTDGLTEWTNQEVEAYLRLYCLDHPETWSDHLTDIEFVHNTRTLEAMKHTPFQIMMGYQPRAIPSIIPRPTYPLPKNAWKH